MPVSPTIADVVMWIYNKHGIWIRITSIPYSDNLTHWRWEHMSTKYATRNASWKKEQDYMSPVECYEAAIEYVIEKLISQTIDRTEDIKNDVSVISRSCDLLSIIALPRLNFSSFI